MIRRPPRSTLPYTTLFRSDRDVRVLFRVEIRNDAPRNRQRVVIVLRVMIGNARLAGVNVGTAQIFGGDRLPCRDRKSTRLNSSHPSISYAVFCLKKKKTVT